MVKPPLRTKSIGFKVSEEEYAQLETAAQADGVSALEVVYTGPPDSRPCTLQLEHGQAVLVQAVRDHRGVFWQRSRESPSLDFATDHGLNLHTHSRGQQDLLLRDKGAFVPASRWGGRFLESPTLIPEYRGARYESLSEIDRLITGTRWSGPLFFDLKASRNSREGK